MKKRLFRRTVAACMTLALSLGGLAMAADATGLSRDSGTYAQAAFESEYTYGGSDLGAVWTAEGTTFRVWAPTATEMQVNLYRSGTAGTKDRIDPYPMTKDVNGTWVVTIPGDIHGTYYTYRVVVQGQTVEVCDPYARSTGIDGQRGAVLNLDATDPEGWATDAAPVQVDAGDAVIYQLDLQGAVGGFAALTETAEGWLSPLTALGATHVELPALYDCADPQEEEDQEQEQVFGDGQDPVNFNVPEGAYATNPKIGSVRVKELKSLIQAIHNNGLAVVMTVDYTHVAEVSDFGFNCIVPGYFSRIDQSGTVSNGSGFGNDTATERSMVAKYIADSLCYWAEEYHIDGFRLESLGLMDTDAVNAIIAAVHANHPQVLFYGDGTAKKTTLTQEATLASLENQEAVPGMGYLGQSVCVLDGAKLNAAEGILGDNPVLIPTGVAMSADLLDYWHSLLALRQADLQGEWVTLFNPGEAPEDVMLPSGEWEVYAKGDTVSTTALETVQGLVTVEPGTAMVLVQPPLVPVETTEPTQPEEPTEAPTEEEEPAKGAAAWIQGVSALLSRLMNHPDLIVAGVLMVLSAITILVVLILKRRR